MSALGEFLVGLLASIPAAAAKLDDDERARVMAELDRLRGALAAIRPNAPGIAEEIERRRAARAEDDTREVGR